MKPCCPRDAWTLACPWEVLNEFFVLLCFCIHVLVIKLSLSQLNGFLTFTFPILFPSKERGLGSKWTALWWLVAPQPIKAHFFLNLICGFTFYDVILDLFKTRCSWQLASVTTYKIRSYWINSNKIQSKVSVNSIILPANNSNQEMW